MSILQASGPAFSSIAIIFPGFHFFANNFFLASDPSLDFLMRSIISSMLARAIVNPSNI